MILVVAPAAIEMPMIELEIGPWNIMCSLATR
jgi:hypothetical protein